MLQGAKADSGDEKPIPHPLEKDLGVGLVRIVDEKMNSFQHFHRPSKDHPAIMSKDHYVDRHCFGSKKYHPEQNQEKVLEDR